MADDRPDHKSKGIYGTGKKRSAPFKKHTRVCDYCAQSFMTTMGRKARFCSEKCSHRWHDKRVDAYSHIGNHAVGAVAEHRVIIDLLERGFEVYTPICPSWGCDILAVKGRAYRIEVKTGWRTQSGKIRHTKLTSRKYPGRHDVLAIALTESILYRPELV